MHLLVCTLITSVVLLDFVRIQFGLPLAAALLPEALSGVAFLLALHGLARNGIKLRAGFVLLFSILLLSVVAGLVIADATMGPLVGGIRLYGKYLPFLLLPMTVQFTEQQLRQQLMLLLGLMLIQFPVAFLQRFVIYYSKSGDMARGTFSSGSINAIVLMSTVAVVMGMYYKKLINGFVAALLTLILFLPPTIAEVKGAFLLLPIALLLPAIFAAKKGQISKQMGKIALATGLALTVFAGVYSYTESTREGFTSEIHRSDIIDFMTDPKLILVYLAPRLGGAANQERIGRIDGIFEPLIEFSDDPVKLATGLGVGAISRSPVSVLSVDQHADILSEGRATVSLSFLLWEFGVLGTALILIGIVMVWNDARYLRRQPGLYGGLALGWLAVVPIFFLSMFWKNTLPNNAVMYMFALFSGHVMSAAFLARANALKPAFNTDTQSSADSNARDVAREAESKGFVSPGIGLEPPPILNEARS